MIFCCRRLSTEERESGFELCYHTCLFSNWLISVERSRVLYVKIVRSSHCGSISVHLLFSADIRHKEESYETFLSPNSSDDGMFGLISRSLPSLMCIAGANWKTSANKILTRLFYSLTIEAKQTIKKIKRSSGFGDFISKLFLLLLAVWKRLGEETKWWTEKCSFGKFFFWLMN